MKDRSADISALRITATIFVILTHTFSMVWLNAGAYAMSSTQLNYFYTVSFFLDWPVTVFLMITGALLLKPEKEITVRECMVRYVRKVALALVIFGLIFSWLETIAVEKTVSLHMLGKSLVDLMTENSWGHLWYLYALLGIYLTLPIWKGYIKYSSRKTQSFVLIVLFVINICLPIANEAFGVQLLGDMAMVTAPVFFLLCGRYLYEETPAWLKNKKLTAVLLVITLVIVVITGIFVFPNGYAYLNPLSPTATLAGIFIFVLFKDIKVKEETMERLWRVDRLCFAVYLIHPVFINLAYKFLNITPLNAGSIYWLAAPGFGIVFVILSFAASWVLNKIKPLRKYVL